jgi:hypothetical protein
MIQRRPGTLRVVTAAAVACHLASCSTTATITRYDGPDNEATIQGSDPGAVYLRGSNGQIYRIDGRQIGDIDHPGNVCLGIGLSVLALGAFTLATTRPLRSQDLPPLAMFFGAPGVGMSLWGAFTYAHSLRAARPFEKARVPDPLYNRPPPGPYREPIRWLAPPAAEPLRPGQWPPPASEAPPPPSLPPPTVYVQPPPDGGTD